MDYSKWAEMQRLQPSNPNPSSDHYAQLYNAQQSSSYAHQYPYYPHQTQNPTLVDPPTLPPGIDSYAAINSYHTTHVGLEGQAAVTYGHHVAQIGALTAAAYYQDTSTAVQNWATTESIQQFGADHASYTAASLRPNGAQTLVAANPNPLGWSKKPKTHPAVNGVWKKGAQKTKIVQSAWCEICKIDCNSKDVLEIHKLGKKHKKNLEKLEESKTSASAPAAGKDPMIGPKENPAADKGKTVDVQQSKKKGASSLGPGEDLETKRRKLMEGGAAADAVRVCPVCNVVCNSQTVFNYHLAGQKHINMVKKQAALAAAGTANPPAGPGVVTAA
ncbi:uncharacterized protein LOC122672855 isoform X1 [Telopea speciosissima]|uniref:uncharacterized protein LOC122672855 isoform X1 n=1 Tax=Telopea speciosissima TaxID=54955 RepID=UPI001CC622AB|nr:uncharacterized protein LOC122672855 isoform X1 [Telopea speciosissima]